MNIKYTSIALAVAASLASASSFAADEADIQKAIDYVKKHEKDGAVKASGFGIVSADGESSINLTGMVHYDGRLVRSNLPRVSDKDSASVADGFEFRRVRLGVNGNVYKDVDYEIIINATGTDTNILETGFLNFSANKDVQVRVGRFRQPYSLEAMTKDNAIDFLERSYGDQLGPNKQLGVGVWGEPRKGLTYALAISQAGFNESTNVDNIGGLGTGRATVNFGELSNLDGQVIHLGASTHRGKYDVVPTTSTDTYAASDGKTRATLLSYRTESRGLANAYRVQIGGEVLSTLGYGLSANDAASVNKTLNDLEFAYANGAFKFQAEASNLNLDATAASNVNLSTYNSVNLTSSTIYYDLIYNLTGERWSDAYKGGSFGFVKPHSNFKLGQGGTGAWQLAVRVSSYKSSYTPVVAGNSRQENSSGANTITYGVNWLLNPSTAVKVNYAQTKFDTPVTYLSTQPTGATTSTENVFSVRAQINF